MRFPLKPYKLADDIESFIHVLHYLIFRFRWTLQTSTLDTTVLRIYGDKELSVDSRTGNHVHVGGGIKYSYMTAGTSPATCLGNATLTGLLRAVGALCKQHYASVNEEKLEQLYGTQPLQRPKPPPPPPKPQTPEPEEPQNNNTEEEQEDNEMSNTEVKTEDKGKGRDDDFVPWTVMRAILHKAHMTREP